MKKRISLIFLVFITFGCAPASKPKTIVIVVTATQLPVTSTNTIIPSRTFTPTSNISTVDARIHATQTSYYGTQTALPTATKTIKPTVRKALAVGRRDFVTYADKYKGQYVVISGIVFNINSNTQFQLFMGGDYNSPVYVVSARSFNDIYKDDDVVVYGTVYGMDCGLTNSFGSTMCQAEIRDACVVHHIYQSNNTKSKNGVRPTPDYSTNPCP